MDIYWAHVAQFKHKVYTAPDGTAVESIFDPAGLVAAQTQRFPLFHAKDGKSNPATANGYDMVPFGQEDIDYTTFFQRMGAKGYHNPMWEQDTAPGSANPGQSLQFADVVRRHGRAARPILEPAGSPDASRQPGADRNPAPGHPFTTPLYQGDTHVHTPVPIGRTRAQRALGGDGARDEAPPPSPMTARITETRSPPPPGRTTRRSR